MKYTELETDSHGMATHFIEANGIECWCVNEYGEDGKYLNTYVETMKIPAGYCSPWFGHRYDTDKVFHWIGHRYEKIAQSDEWKENLKHSSVETIEVEE